MVKKYDIGILLGETFNRITITGEVREDGREREFTYSCECGGSGKTKPSHIVKGIVKSCGCLLKEKAKENLKLALLSPEIGKNHTHGMYGTRQHKIWSGMRTRCNNPNVQEYPDYGGRGIVHCSKWETFQGFWEDMQDGYSDNLTLERKDTNGNYSKDNCKWATMKEQSHNRRKQKRETTSDFIGVGLRVNVWRARIVDPSGVRLERQFIEELCAAQWYDDRAEDFYGHRPNKTTRETWL